MSEVIKVLRNDNPDMLFEAVIYRSQKRLIN